MLTTHEVPAFPDHPNTQALPDEVTLADDLALQADLNAVAGARRMQKTGILDWLRKGREPSGEATYMRNGRPAVPRDRASAH